MIRTTPLIRTACIAAVLVRFVDLVAESTARGLTWPLFENAQLAIGAMSSGIQLAM
jgi:hypothetical protein